MNFFIGAAVSIAALCIIEGVFLVLRSGSSPETKRIKRHIREISSESVAEVSLLGHRRPLSRVPRLNRLLNRFPLAKRMDDFLVQANISSPLGVFVLLCAVLALVGFLLLSALSRGFSVPILGLALGLAPLPFLFIKKTRRIKRFETQLPDALDMIARSLRAGHALPGGLEMAGQEFAEPLGPEFTKTVAQITFGVGIEQALRNMTLRVDCPDLKFLTVSISIQRESGGNLTEILENIARLIRERHKLRGKIRALAAEGKLSAIILVAMPLVVAAVLLAINPTYADVLLSDPIGRMLVIAAVVMMLFGMAVMKKMIDIKA
jgi:tight adherence protein B